MGTFCDIIEDESLADEESALIEDSWSSEDDPEAPDLDNIEEMLFFVKTGVIDTPATEVVPVSGAQNSLRVLPVFVGREVSSLRET